MSAAMCWFIWQAGEISRCINTLICCCSRCACSQRRAFSLTFLMICLTAGNRERTGFCPSGKAWLNSTQSLWPDWTPNPSWGHYRTELKEIWSYEKHKNILFSAFPLHQSEVYVQYGTHWPCDRSCTSPLPVCCWCPKRLCSCYPHTSWRRWPWKRPLPCSHRISWRWRPWVGWKMGNHGTEAVKKQLATGLES